LFAFWQPICGVIWNFTNPLLRNVINTVFGLGFALVFVATLLINDFDLFGLRQVAGVKVGLGFGCGILWASLQGGA
jgi:hypothetical protein